MFYVGSYLLSQKIKFQLATVAWQRLFWMPSIPVSLTQLPYWCFLHLPKKRFPLESLSQEPICGGLYLRHGLNSHRCSRSWLPDSHARGDNKPPEMKHWGFMRVRDYEAQSALQNVCWSSVKLKGIFTLVNGLSPSWVDRGEATFWK